VTGPKKKKYEYRTPFDFDLTKMTVEEAEERLRAMGIEPGQWTDNENYVKEGDTAQLPTFGFYAEMLGHIRDICQTQVDHDVKEIDDLNYQLRRLKRGGGR
jgi:hypothetical protein